MNIFLEHQVSSLSEKDKNGILSKINIMKNVVGSVNGDILLLSSDIFIIFIFFIVAIFLNKKLYVTTNKNTAEKILLKNEVGILLNENSYYDHFTYRRLYKYIKVVIRINTDQIKHSYDSSTWYKILSIPEPQFKHEEDDISLEHLKLILKFNKYEYDTLLSLNLSNSAYDISYRNLKAALDAIDSEFHSNSAETIDFTKCNFESCYSFLLYFLFSSKNLLFDHNELNFLSEKSKRGKKLIFIDNSNQKRIYNKLLKPLFFTKLNILFTENKHLFKPFIYLYNTYILRKTFNLNRKDELVILNSYDSSGFVNITSQSLVKTIYIFGTNATCNMLGINKPSDKKLKIVNNQYRVVTRDKSFRVHTNTLNQLLVHGEIVSFDYKNTLSKQGYNKEKYYNTELYCKVNSDIIEIYAIKEDVFYDEQLNPINIGFLRKGLLLIPYVKDVVVSLRKNDGVLSLIPFVSLNKVMVNKSFEYSDYFIIERHLKSILKQFNEIAPNNTLICDVVIADDSLFNSIDFHYESRYYFIRSISNPIAD